MGLKERRAVKAFQEDILPKITEQINTAAGYELQITVEWESMIENKFAHLYQETYLKIYFSPLLKAIKAIVIDDFGKKILKAGLKQVIIKNEGNIQNPAKGYSLENKTLTINFDPVVNADRIEQRASCLTELLEKKLDDSALENTPPVIDKPDTTAEKTIEKKLSIDEVFNQHAGSSFEKQINCQEILGDKSWDFNLMEGKLTFEGDLELPIQILGTYSPKQKSWMWGWANTRSGIPEKLLLIANDLRKFGELNTIDDFTSPSINNENDPGHYYAMIASGLFGASCYYPIDFNGIKIYILTNSELLTKKEDTPTPVVITTFTQLISAMNIAHKESLRFYLEDKGFSVEASGNNLIGKKNSEEIFALFDLKGRLMKINNR